MNQTKLTKVRADKWLWAARFFRTRSLAKEAIEAGKVHMNGAKIKVSKELQVGDTLTIRQGHATRLEEKQSSSKPYLKIGVMLPLQRHCMKKLMQAKLSVLLWLNKENCLIWRVQTAGLIKSSVEN